MPLTDEERRLVDGCRAGDEAAWRLLYRMYAGDVGRSLKGMLYDSGDVDDLVQGVFLEFLSSLERFRGDASVRTWLHRIARNVALHEIRSVTRRSRHVRSYAETVDRAGPSPEGQVMARYRLKLVQDVLAEIGDGFREVWVLRELVGLSVAEVAEVLEAPEATVRTRHHRARRQLLSLVDRLDEVDAEVLDRGEPPVRLVKDNRGRS